MVDLGTAFGLPIVSSMDLFTSALLILGLLFVGITVLSPKEARAVGSQQFKKFQWVYLAVFYVMMAADWLQGPYVYALYTHYGYGKADIGILFIAGFGSSAIMGTVVGSMADKYGRKKLCLVYAVAYSLGCLTKHSPNYWILMVGRLLGGIATSILFSAFESWMVCEHHSRSFPENLMGGTFSLAYAGNGIVAVIASLAAQTAVNYFGHPVVPFDLSLACLVVGGLIVLTQWTENYGTMESSTGIADQLGAGWKSIKDDKKVFILGATQSCFEGAMYTFVFMWTPTLEASRKEIPHGYIMAAYMLASSTGAVVFKILSGRMKLEKLMKQMFLVSTLSLAVPIFVTDLTINFWAFNVYELCVGVFWSGIGTLRSRYVPESTRSTVLNIFRIPLNVFVCLVLSKVGAMSVGSVFVFCALANAGCYVMSSMLVKMAEVTTPVGRGAEELEANYGGH